MLRKRVSDSEIQNLLKDVQLDYLIEREGGLDSINDWNDVLSGKNISQNSLISNVNERW